MNRYEITYKNRVLNGPSRALAILLLIVMMLLLPLLLVAALVPAALYRAVLGRWPAWYRVDVRR